MNDVGRAQMLPTHYAVPMHLSCMPCPGACALALRAIATKCGLMALDGACVRNQGQPNGSEDSASHQGLA
jgi:hypothetical protein